MPAEAPAAFAGLSERGRALCRVGDYVGGMTLLLEARDSLAAMPADIADNGAYTVPALTESKRLNVVFIANNP